MAQYSVLIAVFTISVLIAHSLCFRVDLPVSIALEQEGTPGARQSADNILIVQTEALQSQTTQAPFPARIRDTVINGIRDFGNNVRQVPNRVTTCFQNISKCADTILRRNGTGGGLASALPLPSGIPLPFPLPVQE